MTRLLHFIFLLLISLNTAVQVDAQDEDYYDQIYAFTNKSQVADILVLYNGPLLLTLYTEPALYRLEPWLPYKPPLARATFS